VLYLRDSDGVVMPELAHEPANQPTQAHIAAQADQSRKQLQQTRIDARYSKGTILTTKA